MRARRLGERDGWVCWLCGDPVSPDAPADSPWAGTVDHIVPRSRGGRTKIDNLRLAHRRCNGERGDRATELHWPPDLPLHDAAALWVAIARLVRRPGRSDVVALAPDRATAESAARHASDRATDFVGGRWTATIEPSGAGQCHKVRLRVDGDPADPGRPLPASSDGVGHRSRRRGPKRRARRR